MKMEVKHLGGLKFEVQARDQTFTVDLPADSGGTNQGPTPPELFCASLATCSGVYIADYCERVGLPYQGMKISVEWALLDKPKRISAVAIKVDMPENLPEPRRKAVYRAAEQCMVRNSIVNPVETILGITYPDER
ncbi:MAG: OsmC family protein [Armatimonadota bacterium]